MWVHHVNVGTFLIRVACSRELWRTVPQSSGSFWEREHFPKFPKSHFENRNFGEPFLKIIWGTFWGTLRNNSGTLGNTRAMNLR